MGLASDIWTGNLEDGSPLDGTELYAYFDELKNSVNDIVNAQVNANAGIAGSKLADNSITGAKLVNDAITLAKMADNSVDTAELVDEAVTQAKLELYTIAGTGVGTSNIEDGAVTGAKIAAGTFGESALLWADAAGVKALHIGASQRRIVYGVKAVSWAGGVFNDDITVTFSTDAASGIYVEDFTDTTGMTVIFGFDTLATDDVVAAWVTSLGATSLGIRVRRSSSSGANSCNLHWAVMGNVI